MTNPGQQPYQDPNQQYGGPQAQPQQAPQAQQAPEPETMLAPPKAVDVVEPVGAGDSFAAGFLHGLAHDEDMRTCLRRGHAGAADNAQVSRVEALIYQWIDDKIGQPLA